MPRINLDLISILVNKYNNELKKVTEILNYLHKCLLTLFSPVNPVITLSKINYYDNIFFTLC